MEFVDMVLGRGLACRYSDRNAPLHFVPRIVELALEILTKLGIRFKSRPLDSTLHRRLLRHE